MSLQLANDIRHVWLPKKNTIGHKRNVGCKEARGEIIVHWDDDDYSAPSRIADQVLRLQQTGKPVTGYNSMRFTDGASWWMFQYRATTKCLGTSLCYRRDWWAAHPFNAKNHIAEDVAFTVEAAKRNQLSVAPAGDLMYATIHAGNTSPRNLNGINWKKL